MFKVIITLLNKGEHSYVVHVFDTEPMARAYILGFREGRVSEGSYNIKLNGKSV